MKIKQAINILSSDTSFEAVKELQYYAGFDKDKVVEQIQVAMNMGAEALRKQYGRYPINSEGFMTVFRCPVCNEIVQFHQKHCGECGQKLDWE